MKKNLKVIFLLAVAVGVATITIKINTVAAGSFPTISLSYINPTTINPKAFSYQMADYDAQRNQVVFYPYGTPSGNGASSPAASSGVLLTYNVGSNNFTSPSSWITADLSQIASPSDVDFGGGFLDTSDNFAYLAPAVNGGHAVQVNLAKEYANPDDSTAYSTIDLWTLPGIPDVGSFSGIFADGYAYFAPTLDDSISTPTHGILIRYNSAQPFASTSSWQWYNLNDIVSPPDPALGGMQSMAYVAPYVYLIPFFNGSSTAGYTMASKIVRYNTNENFESSSSYQTFDLTTLPFPSAIQAEMKGFTGGVVVGNELVLVPWGLRNDSQTNSVAAMFDTTKQLNDPTAWQYIDLTTVNPNAGGYQFGWLDKNGFVWFVPTHNYNIKPSVPPFVVWNSALPFNNTSSWTSYPNTQGIWSTGAAYDPITNTAWFAPYGTPAGGAYTPLITQLQESYQTPSPPSISSFTANPSSISAGNSTTLSWSVSGATSVSLDNSIGTVTGASYTVTPSVTTTYTLTATNSTGSVTGTTTVMVSLPPTPSSTSSVPPEFSDLYPVLQSDLASYQGTLNAQWNGSKSPVLLGAEVTPADNYATIYADAQNNTLNTYYAQSVTPYLNAFQGMGMTTAKFLVQFPMLYQPFYQAKGDTTGSTYQNVVAFYQKLVNDLHSRGMKVIIQTQVQPAGNGPTTGDPLGLAAYYDSIPTFADYVQGRAQNALAIAQDLQPDYLNFSSEPDTEGPKTASSVAETALDPVASNPNFVSNVQYLQTTILNTLLAANLLGLHNNSLKLAVGMGSWEYDMNDVLQNELALSGVDVIDIHVHPINTLSSSQNFLGNILTIANAANAAGKETGMDEDWEYKERNSEFGAGGYGAGSVSDATIDSRDHWSFWAPIDQAFLQAMVDTGYYEHMAYFSAAEPDQFFAYLNYFNTPGCQTSPEVTNPPSSVCTPTQWNAASTQAVTQALSTSPATLTNTGSFYAGLISSSATTQVSPPSSGSSGSSGSGSGGSPAPSSGGGGGASVSITPSASSTNATTSSTLSSTTSIPGGAAESQLLTLISEVRTLAAQLAIAGNENLTIGSQGNNVWGLQVFLELNPNGGPAAQKLASIGPTGYFGSITQQALAEYQKNVGITPDSGYFGPITRAIL